MTTNDSRRGFAQHHRPGTPTILIRPIAILANCLLALSIAGPVAADIWSPWPESRPSSSGEAARPDG